MAAEFDHIDIILANRCFQYQFLQHIFGNTPTYELLDIATSGHTRESLALCLDETDNRLEAYFTLLAKIKRELDADPYALVDKLQDEYTRLFIGPHALPAPPWESVYTSVERALFQPSTLEVRRIYAVYDFLPANYPHDADDHLALELDFMFHLAQLAQTLFAQGEKGAAKSVLTSQKAFLEEHLLNWVGSFAIDIQKSKTRHFYPQTALATEQLLTLDREVLDELGPILEAV